MAEINVTIHGKEYGIACDDGQEGRVQQLAKYIDAQLKDIASAGAASNESHLLVLTALVIADEMFDMREQQAQQARAQSVPATVRYQERLSAEDEELIAEAINHLAARIDSVADRLQKM